MKNNGAGSIGNARRQWSPELSQMVGQLQNTASHGVDNRTFNSATTMAPNASRKTIQHEMMFLRQNGLHIAQC